MGTNVLISKEQLKDLLEKYILPKYCKLAVPTVNIKLWNILNSGIISKEIRHFLTENSKANDKGSCLFLESCLRLQLQELLIQKRFCKILHLVLPCYAMLLINYP